MADLYVIEQLKAYLIAQGVAAQFHTPPDAAVSVILNPKDGAPQPRGTDTVEQAVVTLTDFSVGAPHDLAPWIERAAVQIVVRARTAPLAAQTFRTIRDLLAPGNQLGGRKMWTMGALLVENSTPLNGEQPIGADSVSYDRSQTFIFDVRRKVLAGLPYTTP